MEQIEMLVEIFKEMVANASYMGGFHKHTINNI